MTARDEVLARISAALAPVDAGADRAGADGAPADSSGAHSPAIPRRYRRAGMAAAGATAAAASAASGSAAGGSAAGGSAADGFAAAPIDPADPEHRAYQAGLVDLLVDRLVDYRASVTRCAAAEVAAVLARRLSEHRIRSALVPDGFPEHWLSAAEVERRTDDALTPAQLDRIDGVLCTCRLAIAETGTIVLDSGPGQGRRAVSLVPDYLLVVLDSAQVCLGVPEAVAQLDPGRPLTWISGPSATSDIELNRVEGVHGPRTLDVILIDAPDT